MQTITIIAMVVEDVVDVGETKLEMTTNPHSVFRVRIVCYIDCNFKMCGLKNYQSFPHLNYTEINIKCRENIKLLT